MPISIDFETRSVVNIKTEGVYKYMAHPSTEALIASYRINHGAVKRWRRGMPCPDDLREAMERGDVISAHNAAFERLLIQRVLSKLGWPAPPSSQFRCTAATAAALALPRALGHLGEALDLEVQKDKEGTRLINKFSKPRKPRKDEDPNGIYWNEPEDHPEDFELFHDYCDQDVLAEDAADDVMVPLPDSEQQFYTLQETINDRGIRVDLRSIDAAIDLSEKALVHYNAEIKRVTGNRVGTVNQVEKLVEWVEEQGIGLDSAAKADIEALLKATDLPDDVRYALELRRDGGKSSVSKLKKMKQLAIGDRLYGMFMYHAASTGRTQSVKVNLNNLPRPRRIFDDAHLNQQLLFEAIRMRDPEWLELLYGTALGSPMHLLSDAIRGFLWAAAGHEFIQADYSGIEGMVIAWSSGEEWKVEEMFAIIANPDLPDLYRQTAAAILGLDVSVVDKKHWARQAVGKVSELALGFGGGVAAFYSMSKNYGVELEPLFDPVWASADEETRTKAVKRYKACLKRGKEKTDELSEKAWVACEIIKVGWRKANPMIAKGWHDREAAVREAIMSPGRVVEWRYLKYVVKLGFLWCLLPSGRCLAYAAPHLKAQVWAEVQLDDGTFSDREVMDRKEAEYLALKGMCRIMGDTSPAIRCMGVGKNGRMQVEHLYGGILAENDTQAIARDLLVNGMWKAEAAGYPIVLTVYDEMVAEVPRGFGDLKEFEQLICQLPAWASGMPLTAGGWRGKRYRKD